MSKQEEIRELLKSWADDQCLFAEQHKSCEFRSDVGYCCNEDGAYKCLMEHLDKIGVALKVDRELPKYWFDKGVNDYTKQHNVPYGLQEAIEEAGYTAWEPLVYKGGKLNDDSDRA